MFLYATGYGILRIVLLDRFHFDPVMGSFAIASSSLITVGLLAYMHKKADSLSERKVLSLIGFITAFSLLFSLGNIGYWGYFVTLALYANENVLHPFLSEVLNNRAPEKQRATVLSVASFFKSLPYVLLAPIIGYLNTNGKLEYFLVIWALLILIAVILYILNKKKDTHITLVG